MSIEKDTAFKFIGKNALEILFDLANLSESIDASTIEEVTEELITLKISQLKPDFVGKNENVVIMFEFESSHVGKRSKKRFHAYVALYDYEKNDDDLDIIFCVITTKEKSKIVEYRIGDTDTFRIIIFNISELGFEKIINTANYKIEKQEYFSLKELVELALTSLMPKTREGTINQFFRLSKMMDNILFEDEDSKLSFCGLVLLLSSIYFDINDSIRTKIQGVFMGKIDCITEMREEEYNKGFGKGFGEGFMEAVKFLLKKGFSSAEISSEMDLSIGEIKKIEDEIKSSK